MVKIVGVLSDHGSSSMQWWQWLLESLVPKTAGNPLISFSPIEDVMAKGISFGIHADELYRIL